MRDCNWSGFRSSLRWMELNVGHGGIVVVEWETEEDENSLSGPCT